MTQRTPDRWVVQPRDGRSRALWGGPGWRLLVDGRDVAAVRVAGTPAARRRGLLGQDGCDGGVWFPRTSSVHTLGMRFAIDVAFCDRSGRVRAVRTLSPGRISRPRLAARDVVEAEAGSFERWGVRRGVVLSIAPPPEPAAPT